MGNKFPYFVSVKAIKWKSGWQSFFYIVFYQKIAGRSFLHHFCSLQLSDLEEEEVIWSGRCRQDLQALAQIFVTVPQRTISATIFAFETIFLWIMWIEPGNIGFPNFIRSPNPMMGTRYPLKLWSAQLLVWLDIYLKTFPRESRKHWNRGCFFTGWDIWNIEPTICDIFNFWLNFSKIYFAGTTHLVCSVFGNQCWPLRAKLANALFLKNHSMIFKKGIFSWRYILCFVLYIFSRQ